MATSETGKRAIVVMDAGISNPVIVTDNRKRKISLQEIEVEEGDSEYYLKIVSPQKTLKESAMQNQFCERFETQLKNIAASIHKKGGIKKYGKVCERIGRLKDGASEAHLHLGLLAYRLVNTIRHKLKSSGIHCEWREIVRIRKSNEPKEKVHLLYQALRYKQAPYMQKKSVVPKPPNNKNKSAELLKFMSG
jgi:phosphotransacetylase